MKPRIYVLFVVDSDGECKFIKEIHCMFLAAIFLYAEFPIHPIKLAAKNIFL